MLADLLGLQTNFQADDFAKLGARLLVDLFFAGVLIRYVYGRYYKKREFAFTYYLFNLITFALCFLLRKVPIELGFALGLFAVFGILRYRTESIGIRDLTYLFVVIGIGILTAVANRKVSVAELFLVNGTIILVTALLEIAPFYGRESRQEIIYDDLELLRQADPKALLEDLRERTGLPVERVAIGQIDLLRDSVLLTVYYPEPKPS